ncbi:hypothetical protein [Burkholderia glumae]|uniref:hypothetical protein n=1 Tax=Burkholderia glumae TaxID=337 RepID=UPI002164E0F7|nr:hypothetical protein [Burkholderia glumae]UVT00186.1 hypothetical protein EFP19_31550 [Burkholderia glumae]
MEGDRLTLEQAATVIGDAMYAMLPGGEVQVEPGSDGFGVEIVRLIAGVEGRGDGTRSMLAATALADQLGVCMMLTPDGSFYEDAAAAAARLTDFYSRFGFRQHAFGTMLREPVTFN